MKYLCGVITVNVLCVCVQCIDAMIEKFREKKVMVVAALRDAVDATFLSVSTSPIYHAASQPPS